MPIAPSTLIAAVLVPVALLLGACGNDDSKQELSSATASSLQSKLDQVQQSVDSRDCSGAAQQVAALRQQVQGLPTRVDRKLRDALDASARRLETLIADQCKPETPTDQPAVGTTSESTPQPENGKDQTPGQDKDKKPKKEKEPKPGEDKPPSDTGGATGGSGVVSPEGG
jgi:outer membrane murein-binding lipoprotein Lpp